MVKLRDLIGEDAYRAWKEKVSRTTRVLTAWTVDKTGKIHKYRIDIEAYQDMMIGYEVNGKEVAFAIGPGRGEKLPERVKESSLDTEKILNRLVRGTEPSLDEENIIDEEDGLVLVFGQMPNRLNVRELEKTNSVSMTMFTATAPVSIIIEKERAMNVTGYRLEEPDDYVELLQGVEVAVIGRTRTSRKQINGEEREFKNLNVYGLYVLQ